MVLANEATKIILENFSDFSSSNRWQEHTEFWGEKKPGLCNELRAFSLFIMDVLLQNKNDSKTKSMFDLIEYLILNGDKQLQDAVKTSVLEGLINYSSSGRLKPEQFIHYLGPKSKAYCKAWDEFTGVKTPGLWDE